MVCLLKNELSCVCMYLTLYIATILIYQDGDYAVISYVDARKDEQFGFEIVLNDIREVGLTGINSYMIENEVGDTVVEVSKGLVDSIV